MTKEQTSSGERNRVALTLRFATVALLIAVCLIRLGVSTFGQTACFDQCQAALVQCLQAAKGDQTEEARCQDEYDVCSDACVWP